MVGSKLREELPSDMINCKGPWAIRLLDGGLVYIEICRSEGLKSRDVECHECSKGKSDGCVSASILKEAVSSGAGGTIKSPIARSLKCSLS